MTDHPFAEKNKRRIEYRRNARTQYSRALLNDARKRRREVDGAFEKFRDTDEYWKFALGTMKQDL